VRKIVLTYGLIAGGILSAMMLLTIPFMDRIGFSRGEVIGYTTMVLAFLMIYFGVRSYRDQVAGGSVSFGRAFKVGSLIVLVAAVCYVTTWQVVYYKLAPNFFQQYATYTLDQARADGATDTEVAAKRAEMDKFSTLYQNPLINIAFTFLEPLPVGLLHTLISAGLLSRKRRPDESTS
jgi:hypothetical protein